MDEPQSHFATTIRHRDPMQELCGVGQCTLLSLKS